LPSPSPTSKLGPGRPVPGRPADPRGEPVVATCDEGGRNITDPTGGVGASAPRPTQHTTSTVLLAVASAQVRRTLSDELAHRSPCAFLEAESRDETERVASVHGPGDLAVVDMAFGDHRGDGSAVHLVEVLRKEGWDHVVALGDRARLDRIGATLRAGARGYLFTAEPRIASDEVPDQRPPVDPVTRRVRVLDAGGQERELSHREVEVLRLTAEGLGNSEIGHVLGLSALTVKSHLARITHRLHARDRAHMVLLALRSGAIR
jgi:DNA-binding NarL/FixJ family response regulator